jgi:hypothetical protein
MTRYPLLVSFLFLFPLSNVSHAQCCCDYRVVCHTVYEQQPITAYRLVYETVFEERKVVTQRPVWQTQTKERRYRVAKPVTETSVREQRYQVRKPVWETQEQERQYTVRRPVVKTVMQDRTFTTQEPVVTMRTQKVDLGQFVNQVHHTPGPSRRRLRWRSRQYYTDSNTGARRWKRAGLYWVPVQGRGTTKVTKTWVPNVVTQQIPQTTYQPKEVVQQVPVQVTSYEDQVITQKVPIRTFRWQTEEVVQQIPVTTIRYEYEERVEQIPVRVCKMVTQEQIVTVPRCVAKWVPVTYRGMRPKTLVRRVSLDTGEVSDDDSGTHDSRQREQAVDEVVPLAPTDAEESSDPYPDAAHEESQEQVDPPEIPSASADDDMDAHQTASFQSV